MKKEIQIGRQQLCRNMMKGSANFKIYQMNKKLFISFDILFRLEQNSKFMDRGKIYYITITCLFVFTNFDFEMCICYQH